MRLLTGIRLPNEIKDSLKQDMERLKPFLVKGTFVEDNELFILLNNLGETDLTAGAKTIVDRSNIPKFEQGIGGFGATKKTSGIYFKEAIELTEGLLDLQRQLQVGFMTAGYKLDTAPYKPFLVICKDAQMKPGFNPATFTVPFVSFTVTRVSLIRCDRIDGKYFYSELCGRDLPDPED